MKMQGAANHCFTCTAWCRAVDVEAATSLPAAGAPVTMPCCALAVILYLHGQALLTAAPALARRADECVVLTRGIAFEVDAMAAQQITNCTSRPCGSPQSRISIALSLRLWALAQVWCCLLPVRVRPATAWLVWAALPWCAAVKGCRLLRTLGCKSAETRRVPLKRCLCCPLEKVWWKAAVSARTGV